MPGGADLAHQLEAGVRYQWRTGIGYQRDRGALRLLDRLGEVVFAELPEVGDTVTAGESCGEVESTKSVSDLYSPVTGTVKAVNEDVHDDYAVINNDPFGEGWLFEVEVDEAGEDRCDRDGEPAGGRERDADGDGIPVDVTESGLSNLRRRASEAGGTFSVGQGSGGGTQLVWSAPLK